MYKMQIEVESDEERIALTRKMIEDALQAYWGKDVKVTELPKDNLKDQWCTCKEPREVPGHHCGDCHLPIKPQSKWKCEVPEKFRKGEDIEPEDLACAINDIINCVKENRREIEKLK